MDKEKKVRVLYFGFLSNKKTISNFYNNNTIFILFYSFSFNLMNDAKVSDDGMSVTFMPKYEQTNARVS